ncbi:SDR family NAD(P)-dependent oxidoreductase [Sulfobacillus harzensis]|uniref:SDR family oxidoreductase n=1 Tax=Sulfobacillus harzensis TaxID=2729629 RepID=A0A7Y0L2W8_9FIRM|nr:SDR family NAD(P)-dependent oxidoreductase [Sulfobacillus harzensis]NMP22093.1 SDR family oxidoreductase [Sulfobacillus harzensis]
MDQPLKGQWAIVTGATSGIGHATALRLGEMGANVAIHYHGHREAADEVVSQIRKMGRESRAAQGDFRKQGDVFRVIEELAEGNHLDILVNNAGTLIQRYSLHEMPLRHWDDTIALNLSSAFWAVRAALPSLVEGARIINVSSIAAQTGGGPGAFAYAAAKGGLISLTRGLAKQLAGRNIRVNAVAPGTIDTPFHEQHSTPQSLADVAQRIPLKRLGSSEECAGVIAFLASTDSSYITGEVITVHGGQGLVW